MAETETFAGQRPGATLVGLSLVYVDIDIAAEAPQEERSVFTYEASLIRPEQVSENLYAFSADFCVRRKEEASGRHVANFSASYLCGMRVHGVTDFNPTEIAEGLMRTSVWTSFCSLATIATGQMQLGFPNLPSAPNRVEIRSTDETVEETPSATSE